MRRLQHAAFLLVVASAGLASPLADPNVTGASGPEFQVSSAYPPRYSYYYRFGPASDLADTGDFLVVWATESGGGLGGMAGRAFDPALNARGPEFGLGSGNLFRYRPESPDVTADGGQFVAVWTSYDGTYGTGYRVLEQRFDLQGEMEGPRLEVTYIGYYPEAAAEATGDFIVVWDFVNSARMQRFDGTGAPSWPMQTAAQGADARPDPDVAVDAPGNITVVWSVIRNAGNDGIFGRRFDSTGALLNPTFPVSEYPAGSQREPAIASRPDGGFVAVWTSTGQDGSLSGVFGRIFDANLQPLGPEFQVNTTTAGNQEKPDVSADARGNFVVVWHTRTDFRRGDTVLGQRFDASGARVDGEFKVNGVFNAGQHLPGLAMRDDGEFLVTWFSTQSASGPVSSVRARPFCATPNVSIPESPIVCEGDRATLAVAATGRQPFSYQWRKDGVALQDDDRITGTTSPSLAIAGVTAADAGSYDCLVIDGCPGPQSLLSPAGLLSVQPPPVEVTDLTLQAEDGGATLRFTWAPAAHATDYVVRSDVAPGGTFPTIVGSASDPAGGLAVPLSPSTEFFLVAARSPVCGEGPIH